MKKIKLFCIALVYASLMSCDDDVSDVGGEILTNTAISVIEFSEAAIQTQNISLDSIQSNDLLTPRVVNNDETVFSGNYFLGTQINERSGNVNYGVLFRVEPTTESLQVLTDSLRKSAGAVLRVSSARVVVPYSYNLQGTATDETTGVVTNTYQIVGVNTPGTSLQLDVFRNQFNLELISSSANERQLYYANAFNGIESFKDRINQVIIGPVEGTINETTPNSNPFEIQAPITAEAFETDSRSLQISLQNNFFGDDIVDAEGVVRDIELLTSSEQFLSAFKGIFINPRSENQNLAQVFDNSVADAAGNFIVPRIEVSLEVVNTEGEAIASQNATFNMNAQAVNIIDSEEKTDNFNTAFANNETLTIKGGVATSRVKIFTDSIQFRNFFEDAPIVNQAILRFKINEESPLFDLENFERNLLLNELETGNVVNVENVISDGTISVVQAFNEQEMTFDFTVTNYVKAILNATNFEIAQRNNNDLVIGISELIFQNDNIRIFNPDQFRQINVGSILSTSEVPLYGTDAEEENRPRLIINFTETK